MIVDCHTHLNHYDNEQEAALPRALEELQTEMRRNRVDVALILTSYKVNPGRPSTRAVVEAIRSNPSLFVIAGISHAAFTQNDLDELAEFIQEGKVRGLKLYPGYEPFYPYESKLEPVYQLAKTYDVPVMIHTGDTFSATGKLKYSHPLHVDEVAVDHPDVKFVICHIGNPWFRDTMEIIYKNENVYTDLSGLVLGNFTDRFEEYMADQVEEMLLWGVDPQKCLYGTDWPICSMESYLEFMREIKMPQKDKAKMMYENAVKLFKLPIELPVLGESQPFRIFRKT